MTSFATFWIDHFNALRIKELDKRQVTQTDLERVFAQHTAHLKVEEIGFSFLQKPIRKLVWGYGDKIVLAWAAMHGNESTSLRGWMDLFVNQQNESVKAHFEAIMANFQIHFIPLLNPDGAEMYSRRNAMGLDMNRDARSLATPEMQILMEQIHQLKPVLAFNLHDQRNIFAVNNKPATISFLAPSVNVERSISPLRAKTMDLITHAAETIKPHMTGGIGRYTDEFYPTAVGERVQEMEIPTILVECGASKNDPLRQEARMLNPIILHAVLTRFQENTSSQTEGYLKIPLNQTNQVDFLILGVEMAREGQTYTADIAVMEELHCENGSLKSIYKIVDVGDLRHLVGLETHQCKKSNKIEPPKVGALADFNIQTNQGILKFQNGVLQAKG